MKHILLITDSYPPEIRSASHLMMELAEELTKRNYQVTVVTCWPQYNLDPNNTHIFSEVMMENKVCVIRIKHLAHHKVNFALRGIAQLLLPYLFIRKIKEYVITQVDSVVVYSPPLPLALVGVWSKKKLNTKFILNVQDIFPKNAIDLGVLKNRWIILLFHLIEQWVYKKSDVITVHSDGNKAFLLNYYLDIRHKLMVLHNWVDIAAHQNDTENIDYRALFQLQHKFVMIFAGVIGPSQYLEIVIQAAKQVQHLKDLCFLIVGDGTEKKKLETMVNQNNLTNVIFKLFISRDNYTSLLRACDVGLVSLSSKNKTPVVPGKILGYMAASLPVLAFLNKESDAHEMIKKAQCGYSVVSDNLQKIISVIMQVYDNRDQCKKLGASGFDYVKKYFSKEKCIDLVESFL